MGLQDELNRDTPGRTWEDGEGVRMGVGKCLMGPLHNIRNPRYPVSKTYLRVREEDIAQARAKGEYPRMEIVNALYEFNEHKGIWRCTFGADCGRFPVSAHGPFASNQMCCQCPELLK